MKRITWTLAIAAAVGMVTAAQAAQAACVRDFALAKVANEGTATHPVSGSGTVLVQVLVKADGSHQVQHVIRSTNPKDNDAAVDIATTSTYKPAVCGTTPVLSFYSFQLKFNGSSASTANVASMGGSAADAKVEGLVRSGNYDGAVAAANAVLAKSPDDMRAQQLLGVAYYYSDNKKNPQSIMDSAQAFAKVPDIGADFKAIGAQTLAAAAVTLSSTDPATALEYAKRAVSTADNVNSQFALGVAQVASPTTASQGITTLQAVRTKVNADPKATTAYKVSVDSRLLNAYLAANDMTNATAMVDDIKHVDPSNSIGSDLMGNHYLKLARDQVDAKNYEAAIPFFDQAAALNSTKVAVTANTEAAFALVNAQKDSDLPKAQAYAQKALAVSPDDPFANFAAGVAATFVWVQSHKDSDKTQAMAYLAKADSGAKAASNTALATKIESFQSDQFPSSGSK